MGGHHDLITQIVNEIETYVCGNLPYLYCSIWKNKLELSFGKMALAWEC